jgi:hypothetical protein
VTRDEAIKTFHQARGSKHLGAGMVDAFVALGVLKLDPEPTPDARINSTINTICLYGKNVCAGTIKDALDKAGFKIVEK